LWVSSSFSLSPSSGHCKSLKPAWKAAAEQLLPHGLKLANVDATVETALASRFSVQGYPTIKVCALAVCCLTGGAPQTKRSAQLLTAYLTPQYRALHSCSATARTASTRARAMRRVLCRT